MCWRTLDTSAPREFEVTAEFRVHVVGQSNLRASRFSEPVLTYTNQSLGLNIADETVVLNAIAVDKGSLRFMHGHKSGVVLAKDPKTFVFVFVVGFGFMLTSSSSSSSCRYVIVTDNSSAAGMVRPRHSVHKLEMRQNMDGMYILAKLLMLTPVRAIV
jgi:hypothetical protein